MVQRSECESYYLTIQSGITFLWELLSFDEKYIQEMIDELDESMIQEAVEEREIQVETEPKTDSSEDEQQD